MPISWESTKKYRVQQLFNIEKLETRMIRSYILRSTNEIGRWISPHVDNPLDDVKMIQGKGRVSRDASRAIEAAKTYI